MIEKSPSPNKRNKSWSKGVSKTWSSVEKESARKLTISQEYNMPLQTVLEKVKVKKEKKEKKKPPPHISSSANK